MSRETLQRGGPPAIVRGTRPLCFAWFGEAGDGGNQIAWLRLAWLDAFDQLGRPVVKAFNNIVAASLDSRGTPEGTPGGVCLSAAGDEPAAKQLVLRLLGDLGFDGFHAGSLAESWRQQPGTPAYCMDLDRTALQTALSQPDAAGIRRRRQTADEQARLFFEAGQTRSH